MQLLCTVYCGMAAKNGKAIEKTTSEQVAMPAQTRIKT
jgi:hypothetical protein